MLVTFVNLQQGIAGLFLLGWSLKQSVSKHVFLLQNLESTLEPILYLFNQQRRPTETLGDFCARVGFEAIRQYSFGYISEADARNLPQVGLPEDLYKSLESIAAKEGKSVAHVACQAVRQYVK